VDLPAVDLVAPTPIVVGADLADFLAGKTVVTVEAAGREVLVGAGRVVTSLALRVVGVEPGKDEVRRARVVGGLCGLGRIGATDAVLVVVVVIDVAVVAGGCAGPGLVARTALGANFGWPSVPAMLVPPKVQASTLPGRGSKLIAPCGL
jgi:hypothetical protein